MRRPPRQQPQYSAAGYAQNAYQQYYQPTAAGANGEPGAKRQATGGVPKFGAAAAKPPTAGRYKIVQCRNWKETGSCRFGDSCTYAHGNEELTMHKQIAALSQIPGMQ